MTTSVYKVNKGINRSVEFKGLRAQYIWWLGGGLLILLLVFAILYISGVNPFICLVLIGIAGTGLFIKVYAISRKYGEYGMMKAIAKKSIPPVVKVRSRLVFIQLNYEAVAAG
ncbi:MAG: DUF4133 domain-containing protein [Sphingobacteriales bacterium]|nr:DUF4133 domain-containing protein [Sphingobacteriales bacterium]